MASHQTFSCQFKHLTGQTKFGQSDILYIINGKVIKFLIEKPMSEQFLILYGTSCHVKYKGQKASYFCVRLPGCMYV